MVVKISNSRLVYTRSISRAKVTPEKLMSVVFGPNVNVASSVNCACARLVVQSLASLQDARQMVFKQITHMYSPLAHCSVRVRMLLVNFQLSRLKLKGPNRNSHSPYKTARESQWSDAVWRERTVK